MATPALKLLNLETQYESTQNALETVNTQLCPRSLGSSLSCTSKKRCCRRAGGPHRCFVLASRKQKPLLGRAPSEIQWFL